MDVDWRRWSSPTTIASSLPNIPGRHLPRAAVITRAWGAALTLVSLILVLNLIARLASRRTRFA